MTRPASDAGRSSLRLQVGGTLIPGRHIYIARPEDRLLLELLSAGEYVNILSSRQVGKSSLMLSTAFRLREQGYLFAVVDLTVLGTPADVRSYFKGLLREIARKLRLPFDAEAFWREDATAGTSSQQFIRFFREVIATAIDGPVVLFLDEIDSTLKLPYTDDLFTALRSIYNERAIEPAYQRIAICLVGVATPDELIKDRRTTPYNVGRTLWLGDFDPTRDDLTPLVATLCDDPQIGSSLLQRVLYWTDGHPFLTTRLCHDLRAERVAAPDEVDRFVNQRYATLEGLGEDVHLQQILRFVRERLSDGLATFNLYERILEGKPEADKPSLAHAELKLSGLVKRDRGGLLVPRNRLYERLFNREWVRKSRPKRELARARRATWASVAATAVVLVLAGYFYRTSYLRLEAQVAPLEQQLQARQELEKLQVTLTQDLRGYTVVTLPSQDAKAILRRALPYLQTLGSGPQGQHLTLEFSSPDSFDPAVLAQLTPLRRLVISDPKFSDLSPLASLPYLEELDVSSTAVSDLTPLAGLSSLKRLSAVMTGVNDLAPLTRLNKLEALELSGTAVRNLTPLAGLHQLRQLDLANTPIDNVAPLAGLTGLEELDLSRTRVTDLSPLKKLPVLRYLALDGLGIRDFAGSGRQGRITILADPPAAQPDLALRPGEVFRDCPECPQMVVVPAGKFVMGSPKDEKGRYDDEGEQHQVILPKTIAVGRYEVRFDEWALCVKKGKCPALSDAGFGRGTRPVVGVSWNEARAYADWISRKSGKAYRLLSEAEWEYAARAGSSTAHFWGDDPDQACVYANVADETARLQIPGFASSRKFHNCSDGFAYAAPVGSYQPNKFGLYDMIGNVREWVEDCYHGDYRGAPSDGSPWFDSQCLLHVLRGDGWDNDADDTRSAMRNGRFPAHRNANLGFRLARTLP